MNEAIKTAREIVAKYPGKEVELLEAARDAIDLSDGGDSTHLYFVCNDMIEGLNEEGIAITANEFRGLCNAMLRSDSFDFD